MTERVFIWVLALIGVAVFGWIMTDITIEHHHLQQRIESCHQKSGEIFINESGEYLCLDPRKIGQ